MRHAVCSQINETRRVQSNHIVALPAWLRLSPGALLRLGPDGARGKEQVWRAHVLHWRKYLWRCWDFRRPHSDSAPGELCPPCPPSLHPWVEDAE